MFNELNILKLFFEEPSREFGVRETAKLLKLAPATASTKLKELSKKGILKKRIERNLLLFKADLESESYKDIKIYYTIRKLKESGFLYALDEFYLKPTIILFGSASIGTDTENSDYDFLIISENINRFKKLKEFESKLKKPIQIHLVQNISEISNEHLINNMLNGIRLEGKVLWITANQHS